MTKNRTSSAAAIAVLLAATSLRAADAPKLPVLEFDPARTKVEFHVGSLLHDVHGTFHLSRGTIQFDPQTGKASGELVIDAKSGDSGSGARDHRMEKSILEADKYHDIVFAPDHVQGAVPVEGKSHVEVHGMFRIHGAAHEMTLPVDLEAGPAQMLARTHLTVPYVEWGMKNPSTLFLRVDPTVTIEIQAFAKYTVSAPH